jgi:F-type H+-transporting ATPase subunit gamma
MEQLETLKRRIGSVEDLHAVVRTMKSLAAVNIHHYETASRSIAEYNRNVERGFQILLRELPVPVQAEHNGKGESCCGVVVAGSRHGMCGQFNQQIASFTTDRLEARGIAKDKRMILTLGQRVTSRLAERGQKIERRLSMAGSLSELKATMLEVLLTVERWRESGAVDRILLFYNKPQSRATYEPQETTLFPVSMSRLARLKSRPWPSKVIPIFTMDFSDLFAELTRQVFFVAVYSCLVESLTSENAARLAAMQAAESNIEDRLEELNSEYHRRRQSAITVELLDIVGGFEALSE